MITFFVILAIQGFICVGIGRWYESRQWEQLEQVYLDEINRFSDDLDAAHQQLAQAEELHATPVKAVRYYIAPKPQHFSC
jgi:hypothetical protein